MGVTITKYQSLKCTLSWLIPTKISTDCLRVNRHLTILVYAYKSQLIAVLSA